LKLTYDEQLSNFAVHFYLRCYTPEAGRAVDEGMAALVRRKRARTRWFLARTLHYNPQLITMRRPRGTPLMHLHLVKSSYLPNYIKRGWLRHRGGLMGRG
jgi:hypothetical protein